MSYDTKIEPLIQQFRGLNHPQNYDSVDELDPLVISDNSVANVNRQNSFRQNGGQGQIWDGTA